MKLPVYCINLESRVDRWEQLMLSMGDIWPAVQERCDVELEPLRRWPALPGGDRGCALSHLSSIEDARTRGHEWCLIMEDDCEPYEEFIEAFPRALQVLWENRELWDVYYSGPSVDEYIGRLKGNILSLRPATLTQLVIVNLSVADKLLGHKEDPLAIDRYYSKYARCVTVAPMLTYQRASKSDVQTGWDVGSTRLFTRARGIINGFLIK